MARIQYVNNAESTLAGAISTSATAVTVATGDGAKFGTLAAGDWSILTLVKLVAGVPTREIVKMTGRTGDVLTIVRAQEGSTALTFSTADRIELRATAGGLNGKADLDGPAFTGQVALSGAATALAALIPNMVEKVTIVAAAPAATVNYDVTTQSVLFNTVAASAAWIVNLRGNSGNTLNSLMAVGQALTVVMMATCGATPYMPSSFQIDGVTVTPVWQGGTAPTAGNASSIDAYSITVIKTGNAAYTVLASIATFK